MAATLRIADANEADKPFMIEGLVALQRHEAALHSTRKEGDDDLCQTYLENVGRRARANDGALLIARINGVPVGLTIFWIEDTRNILETDESNKFGYVSDIYVVAAHRGHGVAGCMLEEVTKRLLNDVSIKRLRICSLAKNSLALSAYQSAGFEPYEITYEKRLR